MATLTIRLPDEKHNRLKELARAKGQIKAEQAFSRAKGISVNKLIEELSTLALAEFDGYTRFKAMAATGNPEDGLRILAKLDNFFVD